MCGIWALLGANYDHERHEPEFMRIVGRGPDFTVAAEVVPGVVLGFHRLAIVEVDNLNKHLRYYF
jgi:asparagine synthetase B (glutamine-hydrolysing)